MTAAIRLSADTPLMLGVRITVASLVLAAAMSAAGLAPPIILEPMQTASTAAP